MLRRHWNYIFFAPEDGAGDDNDNSAGGGAGGGDDSGGAGGNEGASSLRAQLAATLPEAERGSWSKWADGYSTDADFAKAAVSMRGAFDNRVPIPKADDKPEVQHAFWERVGKPKEAKEYAFDWGRTDDGKAITLDDDESARFERFKEYAHQHHYTQKQFEAGVKFLEEDTGKQYANFVASSNKHNGESATAMKQLWGPDYDDNLAHAMDAGMHFSGSEDKWTAFAELQLANGMKVGSHPVLLETMANIGRANSEDTRARNLIHSGEAADVKAKIAELEEAAGKAGESTSSPKWHDQLQPLYEKLFPKKHSNAMGGGGFGGRG